MWWDKTSAYCAKKLWRLLPPLWYIWSTSFLLQDGNWVTCLNANYTGFWAKGRGTGEVIIIQNCVNSILVKVDYRRPPSLCLHFLPPVIVRCQSKNKLCSKKRRGTVSKNSQSTNALGDALYAKGGEDVNSLNMIMYVTLFTQVWSEKNPRGHSYPDPMTFH